MASNDVYESRLLQHVDEILSLPDEEMSPHWAKTLPKRSAEQWARDVSAITLDVTKVLLAADEAPTDSDFEKLPEIGDDHRPGVYRGGVRSESDPEDRWEYFGSATGPGKGLKGRTDKHSRKSHRDDVKKRGEGSFFYTIVDQKGKNRHLDFRKLCVGDWESGKPEDVMYMRETCIIAEQIYMGWLLGFGTKAREIFGKFSSLSAWDNCTYGGTNYTPSLKQSIKQAEPGTIAPTTPAELKKKKAAHKTTAKSKETAEERTARLERETKMKAEGASAAEIQAFKDAHKAKMKAENPAPKSDGKGKRYKFATSTERAEEDRLEDHKFGRKTLKRTPLADTTNTQPRQKRKRETTTDAGDEEEE